MGDYAAMPRFTKSTGNPRDKDDYSGKDEPLTRAVVVYAYQDMRGKFWFVVWNGTRWNAGPSPEAAAFYNAEFGTQLKPFDGKNRAPITGDDAGLLVDGIEEALERWRMEARDKSDGESWWLLAALVFLVVTDKRRR